MRTGFARRERRGSGLAWVALCAWALARVASAEPPPPELGADARAALAELADTGAGFGLRADVDAFSTEIPLGAPIGYRVRSERTASLLILHVDAQGVGTLLTPNGLATPGPRVRADQPLAWPGEGAGFSLAAEPPIGRERVLFVASDEPLGADALGLEFEPGAFAMIEADEVGAFVGRIRTALAARPAGSWAATLVEQRVLAREEGPAVQAEEMVAFFTTRARAIRRPRLDLHVHFATGSAQLDATARRNLDQVAQALQDRRLAGMRFRVAGHTDSVGDLAFNDGLSEERARAVVRYLTTRRGLAAERLEVAHYGERRPLESNDTPEGRRMNRRVEFELIRE
jgi:outer membrane protein OmpA-like peptidoglycan-associated protein